MIAVSAGLAAVPGSSLAVGREPAWVVPPVDAFVLAVSPDALVRFAITALGDLGHQLAFGTAIALATVLRGVSALPATFTLRVRSLPALVLGGVLPGLTAVSPTGSVASAVGAGAGAGLVVLVGARWWPERPATSTTRRDGTRSSARSRRRWGSAGRAC